ncbi:hypothetical protein NDU88_009633 [Pleurodeles waltl]|uniref:Uncharacterized protein n=1 Tax=Pleurodeles waltl TaxID=8319 RepID=A0AAV7QY31_PLEWA|nr:hypothetical protein NDU88_009633 [Pleurodeles waltl]
MRRDRKTRLVVTIDATYGSRIVKHQKFPKKTLTLKEAKQSLTTYACCCSSELEGQLVRLMTPRPIRSEDGRDVRGRRGGKAEARTKRGVAASRLLVGLISCGKNLT